MGTSTKSLLLYWRANWQHPGLFMGTMATWITGMILQKIGLPIIAAQVINKLASLAGTSDTDYWAIFMPFLATFFVVAAVAQILIDTSLILLSKLETRVRPQLQMRVFDMLLNQSLTFHANNFGGALVNQTNKFTSAYISLTDNFLLSMTITAVVSIGSIVVLAFVMPLMAIILAIWTVFFVWLNIKLTRKRLVYSRAATEADSALTAHLSDSVSNIAAIKAFGREDTESKTHDKKSLVRAHKKYLSWATQVRNDAVFGAMIGIMQFLMLAFSIYLVATGSVDIGALVLAQIYIAQLIGQLWGLSGLSRSVEQAVADAAEMTEMLELHASVTDPKNPQKLTVTKGEIACNNVTFTHDGSKKPLFKDFTMRVAPGEKIGIVGHSGSGKTSLTRLLLRFVDIDDGSITIDGQDIRSVRQADLRQHIAYVPQEPILFHRSLRENIAYGKPDATDAEIVHAAKMAHAHDFIGGLPDGYDTMVGERGVKLSGGQRQRIAIARAILKDAPILVLDEATSALDSESEKLIQDALKKLMQGRTTIVIAHRLSTVQSMDKIVVLTDGTVAQQGTHTELLQQGGTYADLWKHQSGGFLED